MKLRVVERAELRERRRLAGPLVVAHPRDAGEAEREPGRVRRALLDLVVLDLDDDLGAHTHGVAVVADGEGFETPGHLGELPIGKTLERLSDFGEIFAVV